jgi:hypothetical protein
MRYRVRLFHQGGRVTIPSSRWGFPPAGCDKLPLVCDLNAIVETCILETSLVHVMRSFDHLAMGKGRSGLIFFLSLALFRSLFLEVALYIPVTQTFQSTLMQSCRTAFCGVQAARISVKGRRARVCYLAVTAALVMRRPPRPSLLYCACKSVNASMDTACSPAWDVHNKPAELEGRKCGKKKRETHSPCSIGGVCPAFAPARSEASIT